jgi:hypothetical protein
MIQTRSITGQVVVLDPNVKFVEICEAGGNIAMLIYADDRGALHVVGAKDPEAARYAKTFGVKFCPLISL